MKEKVPRGTRVGDARLLRAAGACPRVSPLGAPRGIGHPPKAGGRARALLGGVRENWVPVRPGALFLTQDGRARLHTLAKVERA